MRPIDADVLLEEMGAGCLPIMEKGISEITGDEDSIADYINRAPTIDAAPIMRAAWISVEEKLPPVEKRVLILTARKWHDGSVWREVTCGFYEDGRVWCEDSKVNWDYDARGDYDEERDDFLIPECWVEECIEEHDEFNCMILSDKVTHWMPLPPMPTTEGKEASA